MREFNQLPKIWSQSCNLFDNSVANNLPEMEMAAYCLRGKGLTANIVLRRKFHVII